ncbi:MAG: creatininase family protein [Hyphomicrobiaceae bacterium]|nr:creatininase family protein [Hyphomicrobiaceae bacterium]
MTPSVMWKELSAEDLRAKAAADAIVVLPVASMEQHGPHLPVGVDTILCEGVCRAGAERVAADAPVVVAPTLWCGMAEHHMAFGGTFTFDIPTYRAVLLALLKSLERHGFSRVFIVNGHGGNIAALNSFLPDFARETSLKVRATTYFELAASDLALCLEDQDRVHHACEVETSLMMVLAPDTVRTDRIAEAFGGVAGSNAAGGASWYAVPARFRSFKDFTPSGVNGDARRANPEKGRKLLAICADGLAATLRDPSLWS